MYEWYTGTVILLLDLQRIIIMRIRLIDLFSNIHADADDAVIQLVGIKIPTRLYIKKIVKSNIFKIFVMI